MVSGRSAASSTSTMHRRVGVSRCSCECNSAEMVSYNRVGRGAFAAIAWECTGTVVVHVPVVWPPVVRRRHGAIRGRGRGAAGRDAPRRRRVLPGRARPSEARCRRRVRPARRARGRVSFSHLRRHARVSLRHTRLPGQHERLRRSRELVSRHGARAPGRDPDHPGRGLDGGRPPYRYAGARGRHARALPRDGRGARRGLVRSVQRG